MKITEKTTVEIEYKGGDRLVIGPLTAVRESDDQTAENLRVMLKQVGEEVTGQALATISRAAIR